MVIVNLNNGPVEVTAVVNNYRICINYLRSKGVKVVGYVHTKTGWTPENPVTTGYRSLSEVEADVVTWYSQFTLDGIFVDETTNNWPASYDN
jgi:hypothetical protein